MRIPLLALIFQGIPESIAIYALAFVIAKIPVQWTKIGVIGLLAAICSYIIRLLPITFGVHTIVLIGLMFFILIQIGKVSVLTSVKASLISYLLLILVETICMTSILFITGISIQSFHHSVIIRILTTLPQVFVLFLITYIIHRFSAFKVQTSSEKRKIME